MSARKKKPAKKKKRTKYFYIQGWGTYSSETPVFVGYTERQALALMKKEKFKDGIIKAFEKQINDDEEKQVKEWAGYVWYEKGYTALFLSDCRDDWEWYETLMHECMHLVLHVLGEHRKFIADKKIEQEGLAYAHEYIFHSIRRKLTKAFGHRK